jgi:hypothetical protein
MSRAKWQQEFDITYDAQLGEKAFPEIRTRREEIVSREGPFVDGEWPMTIPMWAGFDYGARNPSAFIVYTVVDGVTWALWELYAPCKNITQFAEAILACPYYPQIKYIVHDPTIGHLNQRDARGNLTTVRAQFEAAGIRKLLAGNNDEVAWLATMARHWCGAEVTFRITEACPMLIDEFENATFVSMSEKQLESSNYREALVDRHNHALDATKYVMNSVVVRPQKPRTSTAPALVAGYGWGGGMGNTATNSRLAQLGIGGKV